MHDALPKYKNARAFEEMADIVWKQGEHDKVMQFTGFLKTLANTQDFSLLCTYSLDHLDSDCTIKL